MSDIEQTLGKHGAELEEIRDRFVEEARRIERDVFSGGDLEGLDAGELSELASAAEGVSALLGEISRAAQSAASELEELGRAGEERAGDLDASIVEAGDVDDHTELADFAQDGEFENMTAGEIL